MSFVKAIPAEMISFLQNSFAFRSGYVNDSIPQADPGVPKVDLASSPLFRTQRATRNCLDFCAKRSAQLRESADSLSKPFWMRMGLSFVARSGV
jgi:hypothetical protein